jgi:peptidoglycan/xylan/chitin deacetylase (PgdA/CDA1 family)
VLKSSFQNRRVNEGHLNTNLEIYQHPHGVMFHHFHSNVHPIEQGSISEQKFEDLLDWLSDRFVILGAGEFLQKFSRGTLQLGEICLTFDDALKCQFDVAVPVLKRRSIEAFFFVYSSPFLGQPDLLEIYRYFRSTQFFSIDDFYREFFESVKLLLGTEYIDAEFEYKGLDYLGRFPFYSKNDRWFRYLRDVVLGVRRYDEVMSENMRRHHFDASKLAGKLWMDNSNLVNMVCDGHLVGLHSFSHPMMMQSLDKKAQEMEYHQNFRHLKETLGVNPVSMSHPSGSYNEETIEILDSLEIEIGFRSSFTIKKAASKFELPRQDHSNIVKIMDSTN